MGGFGPFFMHFLKCFVSPCLFELIHHFG
jgi:hypothetical protein